MAKVRRNVLRLPEGDETLLWYGRAVSRMLERPIKDPTSWRFQAAIHAYRRQSDPLAQPGEQMPSGSVMDKYWNQCQHGSWYFLPWHRMYLHYWEEIVAAAVIALDGPPDWALPYWDYSQSPEDRLLPEAFRSPTLADGSRNFLFVAARETRANAGQPFSGASDVAIRNALRNPDFTHPVTGGFGGPVTEFAHGGPSSGLLENTPHGNIHVAVGGLLPLPNGGFSRGWMGSFATAALDPVFWLHHANIDRLWEVWRNRSPAHQNPEDPRWLRQIAFDFHDTLGTPVTQFPEEVLNTEAIGYTYEDIHDPIGPLLGFTEGEEEGSMADRTVAELIGATDASFQVQAEATHVTVPTPEREAALLGLDADEASPTRVLLGLENLTADEPTTSYDVYVNVPPGEDPTEHRECFAGRLSLFGITETSAADEQHSGSGLTYMLDITQLYKRLSEEGTWNPDAVRVSLVPARGWVGAPVTVGRVGVYFG